MTTKEKTFHLLWVAEFGSPPAPELEHAFKTARTFFDAGFDAALAHTSHEDYEKTFGGKAGR